MKKNLLILAAAALTFAACSSDETLSTNEAAQDADGISFRSYASGMTRATDATTSTLTTIKVTAFHTSETSSPYFEDVAFNKNETTGSYVSDNKYYWPSAYNLDFYAYGYANALNTGITRTAYNAFTVTPGTDIANQPDMLYARTNDWGKISSAVSGHQINNSTVKGVTINFRHAESQIIIKYKNSNPNLKFDINKVTFGNLKPTGSVTITDANTDTNDSRLTSATWTPSGDATAYEQDLTVSDFNSTTATAAGASMILIPQEITQSNTYDGSGTPKYYDKPYIAFDLRIKDNTKGDYIVGDGTPTYVTAIWPLPVVTWAAGYKYTYTVDLAGGGYFYQNQTSTDNNLDPILEGAEIKFVHVDVDEWIAYGGTSAGSDTESDDIVVSGSLAFAAGGTNNVNVAADTYGQYSITVTGFDANQYIGIATSGTGTFTVTSPNPASRYQVGADGTITITGKLAKGSGKTATITLTQWDAATSGTEATAKATTINIIQGS